MNTTVLFVTFCVLGLLVWVKVGIPAARRARIYKKYGRTTTAENIIRNVVWVGETADQLRDSFGDPLDIDERVLKTKKKEIWKYIRKGTNRYGLRFTVENGIAIGWDEKL
jgi:hypothetical protein